MCAVAMRENDPADAREYLQNLMANLARGAARLQNLLEWTEAQGSNPWGTPSRKRARNKAETESVSDQQGATPTTRAKTGEHLHYQAFRLRRPTPTAAASSTQQGGHSLPDRQGPRAPEPGHALHEPGD